MYRKEINILRKTVHQVGFLTRLYRYADQQNIKLGQTDY